MLQFAGEPDRRSNGESAGRSLREACAEFIGGRLREFGIDSSVRHGKRSAGSLAKAAETECNRDTPGGARSGHWSISTGISTWCPAGAGWTRDPFTAGVEDGRLYGRGSSDMKCGLASAIYAAEALRRAADIRLKGSLRSAQRWTRRAAVSRGSRTALSRPVDLADHRLRDHSGTLRGGAHLHRPPGSVLVLDISWENGPWFDAASGNAIENMAVLLERDP